MVQSFDLNSRSGDKPVTAVPPGNRGKPRAKHAGATNAVLLDTATQLFSRQGYDAVSTRQIAKEAKVNLSAIAYHFGGKEALYFACIEQAIAAKGKYREQLAEMIGAALDEAGNDKAALALAIKNVFRTVISTEFLRELVDPQLRLLMSAVMEGTAAFDRVLTGHIGILISTMSRLVEAATGEPASTERTQLIAIAILNQMMSASMSQPLVLARLDHRQINEDITRIMAENITRAVLGMLQLPDVTHLPTDTPGK